MVSNELEIFKQSILDDVRVMMQTTGQVTQYIGARYVPLFADPIEWSDQKEYEPLTIVTNQGNSYTSRQFVPKGVPITNGQFWVSTGNYDAQIEQYRKEVEKVKQTTDKNSDDIAKRIIFTENVNSMKAIDAEINSIIKTSGFYNVNDGGEAHYIVQANAIANNMDVIALNNGKFAVLNEPYIYIDMLGAHGDSDTDSSTIINYAIDKYNTVYFGAHTYQCNNPIVISSSSVFLQGENTRKSIIKFNGDGIKCTPKSIGGAFLNVKNLRIVGSENGTGATFKNMSENTLFENCVINNFAIGVDISDSYINTIIDTIITGCTINGVKATKCYVFQLINGQIYNTSGEAVTFNYCYNNKIISTDISAYFDAAITYAVNLSHCYGTELSFYYEGNAANDNPKKAGINFESCINCTMHDMTVTNTGTKPVIRLGAENKNIVIDNIHFINKNSITPVGIEIEPTSYEIIIENCHFNNFAKAVIGKQNIRCIFRSISKSGSIITEFSDTKDVKLIIDNCFPDMFPQLKTDTNISCESRNLIGCVNTGNTALRDSQSPLKGYVYYNTQTQKTEMFNGSTWIQF